MVINNPLLRTILNTDLWSVVCNSTPTLPASGPNMSARKTQPPHERSLPPAYVVRREGNSFTLFVCPHRGGGEGGSGSGTPPPPRGGGGYPGPVPPEGGDPGPVPPPPPPPPGGGGGVPGSGTPPPPGGGGTQVRYPPPGGGGGGGYPGPVPPPPPGGGGGGVPGSGTPPPPRGYPGQVPPPPGGGGTRVGQQKEYSLHGGRYASCVHAGGLSCFYIVSFCCSTWVEYTCDLLVHRFSEALHDNSATSVLQVCTVSIALTRRSLCLIYCVRHVSNHLYPCRS